jgi:hypothetical protein
MRSAGTSTSPEPLEIDVAVRAWTRADYLKHMPESDAREFVDLGPSGWTLAFDIETTAGLEQRLRVGFFEVRHHERRIEAGFFYDPEALTDSELELLTRYAAEGGLRLLTRDRFVEDVFFAVAYERRGLVIAANLPFDLSRLAIGHGPAKRNRAMRGGFSLTLSREPGRPAIQVKRVGARATLVRFTIPEGKSAEQRNREQGGDSADHRGYFVDVLGLGAALLGESKKLGRLADDLDTDTRKADVDRHGEPLTIEYLDYLITDVQVTWECFLVLCERYRALDLTETPVYGIYSEASIGKAHLKQFGLKSWRECQPDVPDWVVAAIMETYYGGRTECKIRRLAVAGLYVDFLAQYPTVFVLQGLWQFLIAQGISWQHEDPAEVQALLDRITTDDVLSPDLWHHLHALCLVEPDGDRLPTRARYNGRTYNVALADRIDRLQQWYTLADCIASKLETGKAPRVIRVLRFTPLSPQPGLRTITLPGGLQVDPHSDDLIKALVEQRARVKHQLEQAKAAGDAELERRLDAIQLGMKIAANATAYGIPVELNLTEHKRPVAVTVYRPDGSSYQTRSRRTEEPGTWFHPLLATLVAAGGRLLLATAIALFRDAGGSYVFCDTDSVFATATRTGEGNEGVPTLSWDKALSVADRFRSLNPYDPDVIPGSILELEPENRDPETDELREVRCLSLAAKRYALYTPGPDGRPEIVGHSGKPKRSEHGLGHLVAPRDMSAEAFHDRWWEHLLCVELGVDDPEPEWFDDVALGQISVTSPHTEAAFREFNATVPYEQRVRPWSFCSLVHLTRPATAATGMRCLVAPYERNTRKLTELDWFDRSARGQEPHFISSDGSLEFEDNRVPVQTYRDYFEDYRLHPEAKALAPDGKPCHPWTRGPLQPPWVHTIRLARVGKETNPLADTADLILRDDERAVEYREPLCQRNGCNRHLTGRQQRWCSDACRKRATRQELRGPRVRSFPAGGQLG